MFLLYLFKNIYIYSILTLNLQILTKNMKFKKIRNKLLVSAFTTFLLFVSTSCKSELEEKSKSDTPLEQKQDISLNSNNINKKIKIENDSKVEFEILRDTIKKYGITEQFFDLLIENEKSKFEL